MEATVEALESEISIFEQRHSIDDRIKEAIKDQRADPNMFVGVAYIGLKWDSHYADMYGKHFAEKRQELALKLLRQYGESEREGALFDIVTGPGLSSRSYDIARKDFEGKLKKIVKKLSSLNQILDSHLKKEYKGNPHEFFVEHPPARARVLCDPDVPLERRKEIALEEYQKVFTHSADDICIGYEVCLFDEYDAEKAAQLKRHAAEAYMYAVQRSKWDIDELGKAGDRGASTINGYHDNVVDKTLQIAQMRLEREKKKEQERLTKEAS